MVELQCPVPGCEYQTPAGSSETVACTLLSANSTIHMGGGRARIPSGPKLDRPKVDSGLNQEEWNLFLRRWEAFVIGSGLEANNCSTQLFQCASQSLGDSLLRSNPGIMNRPTNELLESMKSLAVVAVATCVTRTELMNMHQERDEQFRIFSSRVRGKAETCNYKTRCTCDNTIDFTDSIIRDVLIAGIEDSDIRREVLGIANILETSINDIIALVESKEMARDALPSSVGNVSSSTYRRHKPKQTEATHAGTPIPCPGCRKPYLRFTEGRTGRNRKPHKMCIDCYRAKRRQERSDTNQQPQPGASNSEISTVPMFSQVTGISTQPDVTKSSRATQNAIPLPHNIFSKGQWRKSRFKEHPRVELLLSVLSSDYKQFGKRCPSIAPSKIMALADTGAQSCLWSMDEFESLGFTKDDLIPVSINLMAANKSPIKVEGAARVRLEGTAYDGSKRLCATMVYISRQAQGFYLSLENMMDLGIVPKDFPAIKPSSTVHPTNAVVEDLIPEESCSCPTRTTIPEFPKELPFECIPENNDKMKEWLLDYFASSTFNTCPHQRLPQMDGPPVEIHLKPNAVPKAVHTPASIPIHWQDQVHKDLLRDEALGVIERVPYGEPVKWCHRMVVTRKHDGSPRRTVDLSPLNKHCQRETFASASPFQSARRVPTNTWKTVNDAWN
eukprot:TCONS_00061733-protein